MKKITIRDINNSEVDYVSKNIIEPHQRNPDEYTFKVNDRTTLIAENNSKIYGTMSLKNLKLSNVHKHCSVVDNPICEHVEYCGNVGFLCAGYTHPDYTGEGIGSILLNSIESRARDKNLNYILAESWIHGGNDSSDGLLESNGYEIIKLPNNMIDKDWVIDKSNCTKCDSECNCKARMYHKPL